MPAWLPADDRGLAYGDGCFETMRVVAGRVPLAQYHYHRMVAGARRLGIPFPADQWWRRLGELTAPASGGVVKLILTRGSGGRGYASPAPVRPRLLGQWHPFEPDARRLHGLVLGLAPQRLADQPQLAGIKHLNRLEQVLARAEASRQGWHESLMLDAAGRPQELTSMNLFLLRDGVLRTPPVDRSGVAGVMREVLMERIAPEQGLTVRTAPLGLDQLRTADEVFACNSVVGVLPVRKLGLWSWPAGTVTSRLRQAVESIFQS